MIRLDLKREPHWLDLGHGVRVHVRPCTTALMMAARAEVQRAIVPSQNETQAAGERTAALVKALGRLGVQDWQGVGDADCQAVPLTPEGVDALLDLWPMAEAFERLYLGPALLLDEEKNALGPAPNGTSAAGRDTAATAPR
ncbi:MAG: hypothetical protein P9C55_07425 [Defluviicoccus sp.]|nr:hypothetical protein [Defluviicoccus sp.]